MIRMMKSLRSRLLGRWWRAALLGAAVIWPALLLVGDTISGEGEVFAAAGLGLANAAVGIAVHQFVLQAARRWG